MRKRDTNARPRKGFIWLAIIGSTVGSYCRDDESIESAAKRAVKIWRDDFRVDTNETKAVDVVVYEVPDAELISWDHQGFSFGGDERYRPMTFADAGARCFNVDTQLGLLISEWEWQPGRGWV